MVSENINEKGRRQAYPIGDEVNGQVIQSYTSIPIKQQDIDWISTLSQTISTIATRMNGYLVGCDYAKVVVETAPVRFTLDDTDPTATLGWPLSAGDSITLTGVEEVRDIKFIRQAGLDATLTIFLGNRVK